MPRASSGIGRRLGRTNIAERLIRKARGIAVVVVDNRVADSGAGAEEAGLMVREAMEDGRPAATSAFERASIRAVVWKESMSKEEAYRKLLQRTVDGREDVNESRVWDLLRRREAQGSTYLAEDLALPHARIEDLVEPILGVAVAKKGIIEPETGKSVRIVFLLLAPSQPSDIHVRLLSELGSMARNESLMDDLAAAKDASEITGKVRIALLGE